MKRQVKPVEKEKANGPTFQKKVGNVKASVFRNESDAGRVYYNLAVVRRYRDSEGEWRDTNVLNGTVDGLAAMECLRCSIDYINQSEAQTDSEQD